MLGRGTPTHSTEKESDPRVGGPEPEVPGTQLSALPPHSVGQEPEQGGAWSVVRAMAWELEDLGLVLSSAPKFLGDFKSSVLSEPQFPYV